VTLLPVDWVIAVYNLVLIAVWLPHVGDSDVARWMIGVHTAALGVPWLLTRTRAVPSSGTRALRDLYPVLFLLVFWRELGIHWGLVGSAANDAYVARLDQALFGANWSAVWAPAMPMGWLSDLMQMFYFSYYAVCAFMLVHLIFWRGRETAQETTLRMVLVYAGAFAVYAAAPTLGPMLMRSEFTRFAGPGAHSLFRAFNDGLQASGDSPGTAFPSTHVSGAVTLAWLAWRYYARPVAWGMIGLAAAIAAATVYTQNHFVLDAVGGALLAWWCQGWLVPTLTARRAESRWPVLDISSTRLPQQEPEAA
jgi:membrane-associated phospholipid phosphatase